MKNKILHICVLFLGQIIALSIQIVILRLMGVGSELSKVLVYIAPAQFLYTVLSTHFQYAIFSRVNVSPEGEEKLRFYENYVQKQFLSLSIEFTTVLLLSSAYIQFFTGSIDISLLIKVQVVSFSIYFINILSFVYRHKKQGLYYDTILALWSVLTLFIFLTGQPKMSHELVNVQLLRYLCLLGLLIFFYCVMFTTKNVIENNTMPISIKRYDLRILPLIAISKSMMILESSFIIWSTPEYISIYNILMVGFMVMSSIIDKVFLVPGYIANKTLYLQPSFAIKKALNVLFCLTSIAAVFSGVLIFTKMFWVKLIGMILAMSHHHSVLVFECSMILLFVTVLGSFGGPLSQAFYARGKGEVMQFIGIATILGVLPIYVLLNHKYGFLGVFYAIIIRYVVANVITICCLLKMEKSSEIRRS